MISHLLAYPLDAHLSQYHFDPMLQVLASVPQTDVFLTVFVAGRRKSSAAQEDTNLCIIRRRPLFLVLKFYYSSNNYNDYLRKFHYLRIDGKLGLLGLQKWK